MEKNKVLPIVLYFVGLGVSMVLMFGILPQILDTNSDVVPLLIPGLRIGSLWDVIIVYIILPFFVILIGMLLDKPLARLFIWLHKIISLKKNDYFIMESVSSLKKSATSIVSRTIIPAFFSLSIGFLITGLLPDTLFFSLDKPTIWRDYILTKGEVAFKFQAIFFASALMLPLTYLLFSPLWLLEDAGVTFFYKLKRERKGVNIQCVSRYFTDSFKGYISITIIFTLGSYIFLAIKQAMDSSDLAAFEILFSTIAVPLLLITFLIPATLYHEKNFARQIPVFLEKLRAEKMPDFTLTELEKYLPK